MQKANLWDWVKAIVTVIIVIFACLKFYNATFTMSFDFIALLSTLLALFSVGLSAIFYFKATETSNDFYNNTFKFTKDIADLLIRIESGFGERLKSLDEGYTSMRSMITSPKSVNVAQTKEKIELEENELIKIQAERTKLIEELLGKANLEHEEKIKIQEALKAKEEESQKLQFELTRLNKRLFAERMNKRDIKHSFTDDESSELSGREFLERHIKRNLVPEIKNEYNIDSLGTVITRREIASYFNNKYWNGGTSDFTMDMIRYGYCTPEQGLSLDGAKYIQKLIRDSI
ncbi:MULTISPECIES: hypothetical protein [Enterobacter]|uniref:hypothetical protein n=1 Tax=Enterobacter TaxID=547 RepID=UPI0028EE7847|nr:hypothetical protein [Enterobacter cloacae]WNT37856.1 hypothetical protein RRL13_07025 [Enterobacter cloacae]